MSPVRTTALLAITWSEYCGDPRLLRYWLGNRLTFVNDERDGDARRFITNISRFMD